MRLLCLLFHFWSPLAWQTTLYQVAIIWLVLIILLHNGSFIFSIERVVKLVTKRVHPRRLNVAHFVYNPPLVSFMAYLEQILTIETVLELAVWHKSHQGLLCHWSFRITLIVQIDLSLLDSESPWKIRYAADRSICILSFSQELLHRSISGFDRSGELFWCFSNVYSWI